MTAPELKPCPFCGGEASISKDHDQDGSGAFYAVKCHKCRAKSSEIYAVETCNIHFTQVRDAWNSRADLAAVQPAQVRVKPTDAQINSACLSYRHDFGLMTKRDQDDLRFQANEWLIAWQNEARILAVIEPLPDQTVEIDLRVAMMEELEKAASESPWVPKEYYMNEVISDCCAFLREDRTPQPDTRDEVIARLVEALENRLHDPECPCNACEPMLAALAAAKAVQHG